MFYWSLCRYISPIAVKIISLALGQSCDFHSSREAILQIKDINYGLWIPITLIPPRNIMQQRQQHKRTKTCVRCTYLCTLCVSGAHRTVAGWNRMMTSSDGGNFSRDWPFVLGIHRSPVNSPHKGQWRGAWLLSFICAWINVWVNKRGAGDLIRHRAHYDLTVMTYINM